MSYQKLVQRNLNFFFNNLSDSSEIDDSDNMSGGACKKKKSSDKKQTKKKFNVLDFDISDLEPAHEEVFSNGHAINPFIRKDSKTERTKPEDGELDEKIKDDDEGKPINENEEEPEENKLEEDPNEVQEIIKTKSDEDDDEKDDEDLEEDLEEDIEEISDTNIDFNRDKKTPKSDHDFEFYDLEDSESDVSEDFEEYKSYFNAPIKGGRNINEIKDELYDDSDLNEYTKNVKGGLTGGNIKPIQKYSNKLYPYNLN